MSSPFLGMIQQFGFNFAPRGWAFCNGQILPIQQNSALFALLGTTYGGNGVQNFALPNLQSRVAIHPGQGPGLSNYVQGQVGGTESVALVTANLPAHTHTATQNVSAVKATKALAAAGDVLGKPTDLAPMGTSIPVIYAPSGSATGIALGASSITVSSTGGSTPVFIVQPYLAIFSCIAVQGIFPSRN
jgi:microcystin-dependent protein